MTKHTILALVIFISPMCLAQNNDATVKESKKIFTTYDFSDPSPVVEVGKIYPYFRFDGYTNTPAQKEWKIVELENDYIKVMILPEIGGKIWAAWEKSTGKPFIYYNQVVKFRDVAMRGPWTSGGIEANYGIIGHTPNCATPMDYLTETKPDGSVSCYIGTLDLLTQTYWTIEINLAKDKAYFTTRSFWNNSTPIEQPYYTWMNVGMPSKGNLQFIYPGTLHIGHAGEYSSWSTHPENKKDLSFYENNNFGGPKSYHVLGKYSEFFGAYYHDEDFGMGRYSLRDEKAGRKIWIWGLSRQGMIWEKLLTDRDGQYVEVQSGRLFNQASPESNFTPFKQLGFAPHSTDEWTEYWFPVKGTKGFVKANPYGALNVRADESSLKLDFFALQPVRDELKVLDGEKMIFTRKLDVKTADTFSETIPFEGNPDHLTVLLGESIMKYKTDPRDGALSRPVDAPENIDRNTVFGLYTQGKEALQERNYTQAEAKLKECLQKDSNYLPALSDLAMISFRNLDYPKALEYARHAISIDTYDPMGNFYYGLANARLGKIPDAKDGFDIASLTPSIRGAAYTELSRLYFRETEYDKTKHYAQKSLQSNSGNIAAWQILAVADRRQNRKEDADQALQTLEKLTPLNHFVRFERFRWNNSEDNREAFTAAIKNELPHETYLELADFYTSIGAPEEAIAVLELAPTHPLVNYHLGWLHDRLKPGSGKEFADKGNAMSPSLVFPFRQYSADALEWAIERTNAWQPRYYLGLIYWNRNNPERAKRLFAECGNPDFAPFYAARAQLYQNDQYAADLKRAAQLDPAQWRYGKMLAEYYLDQKNHAEALAVARNYSQRFKGDFRIGMLLARALLLNRQYKETTDLLANTTILPYEGATDGRQLYREAWLMQALEQIKARRYKAAITSIDKAKLWPENLGAGKPYDNMIDLRIENYLEALVYEKTRNDKKAKEKLTAITTVDLKRRNQITDLVTALALKKSGRAEEGEKLLADWVKKESGDDIAKWALAQYRGETPPGNVEGNDNFRLVQALINL